MMYLTSLVGESDYSMTNKFAPLHVLLERLTPRCHYPSAKEANIDTRGGVFQFQHQQLNYQQLQRQKDYHLSKLDLLKH